MVQAGHQGMMELLLQYGAKPDVEDLYRRTPLHYCMLFNTTQTAKLLLRKGADAGRKVRGSHAYLPLGVSQDGTDIGLTGAWELASIKRIKRCKCS